MSPVYPKPNNKSFYNLPKHQKNLPTPKKTTSKNHQKPPSKNNKQIPPKKPNQRPYLGTRCAPQVLLCSSSRHRGEPHLGFAALGRALPLALNNTEVAGGGGVFFFFLCVFGVWAGLCWLVGFLDGPVYGGFMLGILGGCWIKGGVMIVVLLCEC